MYSSASLFIVHSPNTISELYWVTANANWEFPKAASYHSKNIRLEKHGGSHRKCSVCFAETVHREYTHTQSFVCMSFLFFYVRDLQIESFDEEQILNQVATLTVLCGYEESYSHHVHHDIRSLFHCNYYLPTETSLFLFGCTVNRYASYSSVVFLTTGLKS